MRFWSRPGSGSFATDIAVAAAGATSRSARVGPHRRGPPETRPQRHGAGRPAARRSGVRLALAALILGILGGSAASVAAQGFAGPELKVTAAASVDGARAGDQFQVAVTLHLPADLHANSNKPLDPDLIPTVVQFAPAAGLRVGAVVYPAAHQRTFPFAEKPLSVYEGTTVFRAPVSVDAGAKPGKLTVKGSLKAQPCSSEACYPPTTVQFSVQIPVVPAGTAVKPANAEIFAAGAGGASPAPAAGGPDSGAPAGARAHLPRLDGFVPPAEFLTWLESASSGAASKDAGSRLGDLLRGGNWLLALPLIFLAGLALNLTPCVYPLIPITVSFFSGQSAGSKGRSVTLASFYVLGMALMYSSLGVAAALTGKLLGSQMQNPVVLIGFAAAMVALGLSMFGLWEIRLPSGLTNRVSARAGYAGALVMGLLVGIVAAPCVGPAVVALLQVVGNLQDPVLGFAVFFTLALGLGVPYLVLGSSTALIRKLPRSGEWMNAVKHVFGLMMFWLALYYLAPVMGSGIYKAVSGLYTLAAGAYLLFFDLSGRTARRFYAAKRGMGAVAALAAVWMMLPRGNAQQGIAFEPYSEARIQQAAAEGRPVLVNFRADWCAACKELEHKTFRDPKVVAATRGMVALQKDMTRADDPEAARLMEDYGVSGLPFVTVIPPPGK